MQTPPTSPDRLLSTLTRDIRSVNWDRQVPMFHLNTKLAKLHTAGCSKIPEWMESCEKFVSCLPAARALCGARDILIDPFRGAREAFPSNRRGALSDIVGHATRMWVAAKSDPETSHTGLYHGNLVEILEMSGLLPRGESRNFYLNVVGMNSTPADEIENLESECEGEARLGSAETAPHPSGTLFRLEGGRNVLWEGTAEGDFLSMEGYGCVCRWRVLFRDGNAVAIQSAKATHTSVTNMAEHVRDACRQKFGEDTKCHEFYEPLPGEEPGNPCEITGETGTLAGWMPVSIASLPHLGEWMEANQSPPA